MTAPNGGQGWLREEERGSIFWLKVIVTIARKMGRPVARFLLYPITLFFFVRSGRIRAASRQFLGRALGRRPGWIDLFRHQHVFASTILDRVFFLGEDFAPFDLRFHGRDEISDCIDRGQGVILLGAHFGSFEVMRCFGMSVRDLPVNILIYEDNSQRITGLLNALNPKVAQSVINIGRPDALIKVKERLDAGEIVGILGDRIASGEKSVALPFLGEEARFSLGPMMIANVTKAPVFLFYGIYRGKARYDIVFEKLAERIDIPRAEREEGMKRWVGAYAEHLEAKAKEAPFNWFNFYDFWEK